MGSPLRGVQIWPLLLSFPLELRLRRRTFVSHGVLQGRYCLCSSFLRSSGSGYVCSSGELAPKPRAFSPSASPLKFPPGPGHLISLSVLLADANSNGAEPHTLNSNPPRLSMHHSSPCPPSSQEPDISCIPAWSSSYQRGEQPMFPANGSLMTAVILTGSSTVGEGGHGTRGTQICSEGRRNCHAPKCL